MRDEKTLEAREDAPTSQTPQVEASIEYRANRARAERLSGRNWQIFHGVADVDDAGGKSSSEAATAFDESDFAMSDNEEPSLSSGKHISATPFVLRDPTTIPPREWVYGGHYIRRFITTTVAAGGTGKSALLLTEAVAMATGKPLLRHPVREPVRVWYWCGEDPREEIDRRLHAICKHYGVTIEDLGGRLFIDSGRDTEIKIAVATGQGCSIATPVIDDMIAEIRARQIDVVILDPMVSTHSVSENDNMAIDAVAKAWGRVAGVTNCAIELAHHIRKTGGEASVDDARGASALKDAARSVRVLNKMTRDEAASGGVKIDSRFFFRIDYGDKANMRPPCESSEWHQMVSVKLGNHTERLSGDNVGVPTVWNWPGLFDGLTSDDSRRALEALRDGGYRTSMQSPDWAGHRVGEVLGIDVSNRAGKKRLEAMLKEWVKNGQLKIEEAFDKQRKPRPVYVVVDSP